MNALPVLEPLSKATQTLLTPLKFQDTDYLKVTLDDECKRFIVQAQAWEERQPLNGEEITTINGKILVKSRWGPSSKARHQWLCRIPEKIQRGFEKHSLAATDFTVLVLRHVWPTEKLIFSDDAYVLYRYLVLRFFSQSKAASIIADYKINKVIPEMPSDFIDHPELPLSDYQKVGLVASLEQEAFALFMEQGTGKTPIVINRVNLEGHRKDGMYRALIMCPRNVRLNWEREFERFSTFPGKVGVLRGSLIRRTKNLIDCVKRENDCEWSASIISTDSVDSIWRAIYKVPWDLVVLDESHYIKNHRSKRFRVLRQFANPKVKARMVLTGTPIANVVFDVWAQFEFLGAGLSGFSTFQNFRAFHGKFKKIVAGGTPISKLVGLKALPLIQERLSRLSYLIRKDEAGLGLPAKVYDLAEVEMTPRQEEYYKKISTELVLKIEEEMTSGKTMSVDHVLTMLMRLAQITAGHVRWDGEGVDKRVGGIVEQIDDVNPKIEEIIEMIKANNGDCKTVVWSCFVEDIRALSARLAQEGINHVGYHRSVIDAYRVPSPREAEQKVNLDPTCMVFIGNPASAGEGLNILGYDRENPDAVSTYTGHVIYMTCNWSMIQRSQSEDRTHRRGTRMPVRVTDLVIPGTIDEEIRARVLAKKKTALMVQDLRDILKRIIA